MLIRYTILFSSIVYLVLGPVSSPFEAIRPSCLSLVHRHIVEMANKSSRVSHTSSRLVWTWLLTQPIHWPLYATAADRILIHRTFIIMLALFLSPPMFRVAAGCSAALVLPCHLSSCEGGDLGHETDFIGDITTFISNNILISILWGLSGCPSGGSMSPCFSL